MQVDKNRQKQNVFMVLEADPQGYGHFLNTAVLFANVNTWYNTTA